MVWNFYYCFNLDEHNRKVNMCNKVLSRDKLNKNPTPLLCNQEVLSQNKRKILPRPSLIQEKWGSGYQITTKLNIFDIWATKIRTKNKVLRWGSTTQTCVQRSRWGAGDWSDYSFCFGAQGAAPGWKGGSSWFLPPASLRSPEGLQRARGIIHWEPQGWWLQLLSRVKSLFHRHGDLQEPDEQTAAAPECHKCRTPLEVYKCTKLRDHSLKHKYVLWSSRSRGWPQHSHKMLWGRTWGHPSHRERTTKLCDWSSHTTIVSWFLIYFGTALIYKKRLLAGFFVFYSREHWAI